MFKTVFILFFFIFLNNGGMNRFSLFPFLYFSLSTQTENPNNLFTKSKTKTAEGETLEMK